MSVVQNPFIGRARQKAGGMVFSTWKGINVLKTKPLTVANPKTDKQLMRRSALSQIVAIARAITAAINLGFKEQAVQKSAFNAFTGYNLRNAFNYTTPPTAAIQETNLLVSQGTITSQPMTSIVIDKSENEAQLQWDEQSAQPGQSASDIVATVFHNVTKNKWYAFASDTPRSDGAATITLDGNFISTGDDINCWTFFYNVANRKSSDSTYLNTDVVA